MWNFFPGMMSGDYKKDVMSVIKEHTGPRYTVLWSQGSNRSLIQVVRMEVMVVRDNKSDMGERG